MNSLIAQIKHKSEYIEDLCANAREDIGIVDEALLRECLSKLNDIADFLEQFNDFSEN